MRARSATRRAISSSISAGVRTWRARYSAAGDAGKRSGIDPSCLARTRAPCQVPAVARLPLQPMLFEAAALPPAPDDGWAYEPKWDGMRAIVAAGPGAHGVWSRNATDFTAAFPELAGLVGALGGH